LLRTHVTPPDFPSAKRKHHDEFAHTHTGLLSPHSANSHTFFDGIAIAIRILVSDLAVADFFAVFLHKIPKASTVEFSSWPRTSRGTHWVHPVVMGGFKTWLEFDNGALPPPRGAAGITAFRLGERVG